MTHCNDSSRLSAPQRTKHCTQWLVSPLIAESIRSICKYRLFYRALLQKRPIAMYGARCTQRMTREASSWLSRKHCMQWLVWYGVATISSEYLRVKPRLDSALKSALLIVATPHHSLRALRCARCIARKASSWLSNMSHGVRTSVTAMTRARYDSFYFSRGTMTRGTITRAHNASCAQWPILRCARWRMRAMSHLALRTLCVMPRLSCNDSNAQCRILRDTWHTMSRARNASSCAFRIARDASSSQRLVRAMTRVVLLTLRAMPGFASQWVRGNILLFAHCVWCLVLPACNASCAESIACKDSHMYVRVIAMTCAHTMSRID